MRRRRGGRSPHDVSDPYGIESAGHMCYGNQPMFMRIPAEHMSLLRRIRDSEWAAFAMFQKFGTTLIVDSISDQLTCIWFT